MKINILIVVVIAFGFYGCESNGMNDQGNREIKKSEQPILQNGEDSSCIIKIFDTALEKEYNCYMHFFSYKNNIVFTDSNTEYTQYYYPLPPVADHVRVFDRYDSPVGIRKLLVFDTKSKDILMSDWFDKGASGDSIDIKSIDLVNNTFTVRSFETDFRQSYKVSLRKVSSW